jgi:hypothetical protein
MKVRRWLSILVVFAPAAAPVLALPAVQTGLLGLARGETARVTVINLTPQSPEAPPSPCLVKLGFRDENGGLFLDQGRAPLQKESRLETGEAATLALPAGLAFSDTRSLRRPFRAVVERNSGLPDLPPSPCDGLATSLEIYDNRTGEPFVSSNLGAPTTENNPGPSNSPLGLLGLARFENAELHVINLAEERDAPPCDVPLTFVDRKGEPFFDRNGEPLSAERSLGAGEWATLVLPWQMAFQETQALRRPFRAVVENNPGPPTTLPNPCVATVGTLEIYDVATGRTLVQLNTGPSTVGQTTRIP